VLVCYVNKDLDVLENFWGEDLKHYMLEWFSLTQFVMMMS